MALQDVQSLFTSLLNRRDCPAATAQQFITLGQQRIQRQLRIPSMERAYVVTVPHGQVIHDIPIPEDLLQVIDFMVDGRSLEHKGLKDLARHRWQNWQVLPVQNRPGCAPIVRPEAFARVGATFRLAPLAYGPCEIVVTYYGAFTQLVNPTDTNELTPAFNDLLAYAALTYAGDWSRNDQLQVWQQNYEAMMQEVQDSANQLDATGGSLVVRAPHGDY